MEASFFPAGWADYCCLFSALDIRHGLKVTQCIFLSAHLNVWWFKLVWPNWSCEAKIFLILDILYMSALSFTHMNTVLYNKMQNDPGNPVLWECPQLAAIRCCIWHPFKNNIVLLVSVDQILESMYYWCQRDEFLVMRVLVPMEYLMKKKNNFYLLSIRYEWKQTGDNLSFLF